MALWNKLFGGGDVPRVDYYNEGEQLLKAGNFHEALTSFRLALKEATGDATVLQQIAICYTRIGMTEEAAKTYRHVLQKNAASPGAHYGLAFLLLRSEEPAGAAEHLEAFLAHASDEGVPEDNITHARSMLAQLRGEAHEAPSDLLTNDLF